MYQFAADKDVKEFDYWEWVRAYLDDKHDPDGYFYDYKLTSEEQQENDGLVYEATLALPLVTEMSRI